MSSDSPYTTCNYCISPSFIIFRDAEILASYDRLLYLCRPAVMNFNPVLIKFSIKFLIKLFIEGFRDSFVVGLKVIKGLLFLWP